MTQETQGQGRLLLIDYHFGMAGATGGNRWRATAGHLAAEGWCLDVITAGTSESVPAGGDPAQSRIHLFPVAVPATLENTVAALGQLARRVRRRLEGGVAPGGASSGAWVDSAPVSSSGAYARLASVVHAVRITAPEWGWTRRAARLGCELARQARYRAVIVSSPPHLTQLAGRAVRGRCGVPYVADFRDPWVFGRPEMPNPSLLTIPLGRVLERSTLRRAALILCNTDHAQRSLATLYPELTGRVIAVPNGYDADGQASAQPDPRCFRIVFTGFLYPFMDADCVLAAAGRLRRRAGLCAGQLAVEFMGCSEVHRGESLHALTEKHGLHDCFTSHRRGTRVEARRLQEAAAVLVAFDASTQLAMPTKFYDYAQMRGTMLLVGFPDGALAAASAALGIKVHAPDDDAGLDAAFDEALRRWRGAEFVAPLDREGLFDRRRQGKRVHELLLALPH